MTDASTHTDAATVEAADWFLRLRDPACTAMERRAFEAWLARDPRHAEEYRQFEQLWAMTGHVQPRQATQPPQHRGRPSLLRVAALLLLGVPAIAWSGWQAGWLPDSYHRYQATNEVSRVRLPDGSEVELDRRTALTFANFKDARRVTLARGVAYFHASHDSDHPFQVKAGRVNVTVTGTRFSVWAAGEDVTVTVAEGSVKVSSHASGEDAVLTPGTQAHYAGDGGAPAVGPADLDSAMAWREGRLLFHDLPLAQAIPQVNRYLNQPLVLADAATGNLRIGGAFDTSNMSAVVAGLSKVLPVTIAPRTDGTLEVALKRSL